MTLSRKKIQRWLGYFYRVPWCVPAWGLPELFVTSHCILSGQVIKGPYESRLLHSVKKKLGVKYAIAANKGRAAIELALRGLNIKDNDEVILPAYICQSVLDAIARVGAQPVFADIDSTLHVTKDTIRAAMTSRTKAVIVPHLFGNTAGIDEIEKMLKGTGIYLIDDAAQSFGASQSGRLVGTFGDCGILSCGPGKTLAGFAGGVLVTSNVDIYCRANSIPLQNQTAKSVAKGVVSFWIWRRLRKYTLPAKILIQRIKKETPEALYEARRISNLDAGIGLMQLRSLQRNILRRKENAQIILDRFRGLANYSVSVLSTASAITKLVLVLPDRKSTVEIVNEYFNRCGIECQGGYTPLHIGNNDKTICLPETERLWKNVLCIPVDMPYKGPRNEAAFEMQI